MVDDGAALLLILAVAFLQAWHESVHDFLNVGSKGFQGFIVAFA